MCHGLRALNMAVLEPRCNAMHACRTASPISWQSYKSPWRVPFRGTQRRPPWLQASYHKGTFCHG
jgi:hypothetical protein